MHDRTIVRARPDYNPGMPEITPLRPDQVADAKIAIWTTAYNIWHDRSTLEETIALYRVEWPLQDIDEYEAKYVASGGAFLVVTDGGRVVGTGALRRLDEGIGEIKRLWLMPEYQGQGLGYRMMEQLIGVAREKGYTRLRLETTPAYQTKAFHFYQRLGFYVIPTYSDHPEDDGQVGMELVLS